jgi:hypothetical protein
MRNVRVGVLKSRFQDSSRLDEPRVRLFRIDQSGINGQRAEKSINTEYIRASANRAQNVLFQGK